MYTFDNTVDGAAADFFHMPFLVSVAQNEDICQSKHGQFKHKNDNFFKRSLRFARTVGKWRLSAAPQRLHPPSEPERGTKSRQPLAMALATGKSK